MIEFQEACEIHWDAHGTYESENDACPSSDSLVGTCDLANGGALIGASYEGDTFGGTLYYYSDSRWGNGSDHCTSLNGTFATAD